MKTVISFCLLFVLSFSYAQVLKVGDSIHVSYGGVKFKTNNQITCEAIVNRGDLEPLLLETPMQKVGDEWKCSFLLSDTASQLVMVRYSSGEQIDDNDGNPMCIIVYGKDKKPVMGAHLDLGNFYLYGRYWEFKRQIDLKTAKDEFEKEKKFYSKSWKVYTNLFELSLREDTSVNAKKRIKKELGKFYTKYKQNEDAVITVAAFYGKINDTVTAKKIREEYLKKHPTGKIAQQKMMEDIRNEKDSQKRIELMNKLLNEYPNLETLWRQNYTLSLIRAYIKIKEFEKADDLISNITKPDVGFYNSISWPLIDKGEQLDRAMGWAKKGIEIARNQTIADKPPSMKIKDWEENHQYTLAMILDTYGTGLIKQEKVADALSYFEEAYKASDAGDADMNTHYIEALLKNNDYEKSIATGIECIKKGKDSPEIIDIVKEAYTHSIGSKMVFDSLGSNDKRKYDSLMADAQKAKKEALHKKIVESRISKPQIDFTLKDLNSTSVTLSSMKGKVVVIDFWATWCGPCKQSFPYLQKAFEKYQNNPHVTFLAVNSWERQADYTSQLANAKKFIEENKYTFPVLLDEQNSDQFKVINDYEVDGIPTKFIIDKAGNIAFKSVGFDGPGMVDELTEQIEILLSE